MPKIKEPKSLLQVESLERIRVRPGFNPRKNPEPSLELIESIRGNQGVVNPIKVRHPWADEDPEYLYIVGGERRYNACITIGLTEVVVEDMGALTELEATIVALLDNAERGSLTKSEKRKAIIRMHNLGESIENISKVLGHTKQYVSDIVLVENRGDARLRAAAAKDRKEGGIDRRVAATAAKLPKSQQRKAVKEVRGKTRKEGMAALEKKFKAPFKTTGSVKVKKPSDGDEPRYRDDYPFVDKPKELCQDFEKAVNEKLELFPKNKTWKSYKEAIDLFKGLVKLADLV